MEAIHTKLYPLLKKAKQEKQSAFFKVDKLIINGQVYNGIETENLPYYGSIMNSAEALVDGGLMGRNARQRNDLCIYVTCLFRIFLCIFLFCDYVCM